MKMRTFIGLCAALAFAAGSTTVHALKIVSESSKDPAAEGRASNTYAKETLLTTKTTPATGSDTTKYYNIAHESLYLSAPAGITAIKGDTYVVSYTLEGMVFGREVKAKDLTAALGDDKPTFTKTAYGAAGDKTVTFRLAGESVGISTIATNIALKAEFAISAAGSGSVTRTVENRTLGGQIVTHEAPGVIKLGTGLKETVMVANPIATVAHSFRSFNKLAVGTVGSLEVTIVAAVRHARDASGKIIDKLSEIINNSSDSKSVPNSTVKIMGNFSFATKAFLNATENCLPPVTGKDGPPPPVPDDILTREGTGDNEIVTGVKPQNVKKFADKAYLCIMVDPDDEDGMKIPATAPYTAMGNYATIINGAFDPAPMMQTLGSIKRDGTTVYFPFLTSQTRYSQVLRVTNRGGDAPYTFSSDAMDDKTGTLMGDMTTQLLIRDLIGEGVGGTSGILIIESVPTNIDVAIVHVNRGDGSTDTVIYPTPTP